MMKKYFVFLLLSIPAFLFGQESPCQKMLLDYVNSMQSIKNLKDDQVYRMKYNMTITYNKADMKTENISAELLMSNKKSFYESKMMSMYADSMNGFVILPMQKQIIWGPGNKNVKPIDNIGSMLSFQDSLIRISTIIACTDVFMDSTDYKLTTLKLPEAMAEVMKVKSLTLYYNKKKKLIDLVNLNFTGQSEIKTIQVNYEIIDFNYTGPFADNAFQKVFESKHKVHSAYKSYEIIDNRSKN